MNLNEFEQKICVTYSARGEDGRVRCNECPLKIDRYFPVCKVNCTEDEWNEYINGKELEMTGREQCLEMAKEIVIGSRDKQYGNPEDNFSRIANLWNAHIENRYGLNILLDRTDVALMMDLLKTARIESNPKHKDNYIDKCGYSACMYEFQCDSYSG